MSDLNSRLALHQHYTQHGNVPNRTIFCHDNLEILQGINSECIDLIYLDPPFNKRKVFTAPIGSSASGASFKDILTQEDVKDEWIQTIKEDHYSIYRLLEAVRDIEGRTSYNFCYLAYMAIRLIEMHRVLKDTGSIYLHCDPTMSHYIKLLMDCVFSESNFRNEVVWGYRKWNIAQNQFPSNHDLLLFYSKTSSNTFNTLYMPKSLKSSGKGKAIQSVIDEKTGKRKSIFLDKKSKGTPVPDWFDISIINPMAKERTGYPTQKPLALLERIIKASSNKGDMILDPFCGCATTCVAAEKLERQWIGIDISVRAYELVQTRIQAEVYDKGLLSGEDGYMPSIHFQTDPPQRTDSGRQSADAKYVYVISHKKWKGEYKVGIASDWKSRLNQYQTSDPNRNFKIEYKIRTSNYRKLENHIHKKFDNKHEWVRGDLSEIIKEIEANAVTQSDEGELFDAT